MPDPYSAYDAFAWLYRRGWGEDFHRQARPVLEANVFTRLTPGARVLDLCCGTGDLSAYLVEQGFQVTGIDGSCEMLRYAREKVPSAAFVHADARSFDLPTGFDAVVSTFDSLNHVIEPAGLEQVFANVHRVLDEGGLFAFDMNIEDNFATLWKGSWTSFDDEAVGITRGSFDPDSRIGQAEITVFRREASGLWSRSDAVVQERCYAPDEIGAMLARAGFRDTEMHDAGELGMRDVCAIGRKWFFTVK